MSYTTQYGTSRYDDLNNPRKKRRIYPFILLVIAIMLLHYFIPEQMAAIRDAFFPYMTPEVRKSFAEMASSVRSGTDFSDAAAVFCQEILHDPLH